MSDDELPVTTGTYGETRILPGELSDHYEPIDEDGDVKAKLWEGDKGNQRLYLRIRDNDDGRKFNEYAVDLGDGGGKRCSRCGDVYYGESDLKEGVCRSCRRKIGGHHE